MDDRELLRLAHDRWLQASEAETALRTRMEADLRFANDIESQWPDAVRQLREADNRPCLVVDQLSGPIDQVVNQIREALPVAQVNPVGDGADPERAEVRQGLIRRTYNQLDGIDAVMWAVEHQVKMGRGFWRVRNDFPDDDATVQELYRERILDQFSVYYDPAARKKTKADARFCFIVTDFSHEEYKARYGESGLAKAISADTWQSIGDAPAEWLDGKSVRVAEYFCVEETRTPAENGRERVQRKVCWYLINATEVLQRGEIPGPYIPVLEVIGKESRINGKRDLRGMVRNAKSPQLMANVWESAITEAIGLGPRAPYIVAAGQVDNYKEVWDTANTRNWAYLPYDPQSVGGTLAPAPQRNVAEAPIQAMALAAQRAENHIRRALGHYDVQSEEQRPEQSGKAILARQRQGETTNATFTQNLADAMRYEAQILMGMFPTVYDVPRVMRIVGADDNEMEVVTHAGNDPAAQQLVGEGIKGVYDLSVGKYDVVVSVGPSHLTKRQEATEAMGQVFQAMPQLMQILGDLWLKNMDWPGAREMAERLKKMLPPQLQEGDKANVEQQYAQLMQQAQQAQILIDGLTKQNEELNELLERKVLDLNAKKEIVTIQESTKVEIEKLRLAFQNTKAQIDAAQTVETQARDHAHQRGLASIDAHAAELSQMRDQAHQRGLQAEAAARASQQQPQEPAEGMMMPPSADPAGAPIDDAASF